MTSPGVIRYTIICSLAAVACSQVLPVVVEPINELFLHCLCDALAFPCDHNRACSSAGNIRVCGPFGISEGYWKDGGMHVVAEDNSKNRMKLAFQTCALDLSCAAKTVEQYMTRLRKDCNSDGAIDGMDYALTHILGGYAPDCSVQSMVNSNNTSGLDIINRFSNCTKRFSVNHVIDV